MRCVRFRNRLRQMVYRPRVRSRFLPERAFNAFNEMERKIEETITPLFSELFD